MKKQKEHYTPEQKGAILRRYLVEGVPILDLCDELRHSPTAVYRRQKQFFQSGATAFQRRGRTNH
ncbi:MAG: transposase [Candidatus Acidiferrales bacterium]